MRDLFACEIGLSDHTMGIGAAIAAVSLGASVIEKHFTLNRADGGVDSAFSLEPEEFSSLVVETKRAWQSLGQVQYGMGVAEQASAQFRRSLYIAKDMEKDDMLTPDSLRIVRPGGGISPKYYEILLGRRVNQKVTAGTPVRWDIVG